MGTRDFGFGYLAMNGSFHITLLVTGLDSNAVLGYPGIDLIDLAEISALGIPTYQSVIGRR